MSKAQIERAKKVDILDYLQKHEPDNLKRIGRAHYLRDHDSFEISNDLWNWHSRGIGGKNVVDYLMKVRGLSFVDAVCRLAGEDYSDILRPPKPKPVVKPALAVPPRNR